MTWGDPDYEKASDENDRYEAWCTEAGVDPEDDSNREHYEFVKRLEERDKEF